MSNTPCPASIATSIITAFLSSANAEKKPLFIFLSFANDRDRYRAGPGLVEDHPAQGQDGVCSRVQVQDSAQPHPWLQPQLVVTTAQLHESPHEQAGPQLQAAGLGSVFTGISLVGLD